MDRAQLIEDIQVHFPLYVVTFFLASCSILYELIVAQTLSLLAANTVIWYSVTVGLFLLGMGLGSLLSKLLGTQGRTLKTLVTVEVLLSLVGLLMVPYLHVAHMLFSSFAAYNETLVGIAFFFIGGVSGALVIGILTGIELPLLIRIREENAKLKRDGTHVVLGIDYVGSLLGAVAFPLVLVPHLDLMVIAALVSSVNAIIAIVLIAKFMHTRSSVLIQGVTSVTILIGAAAVITHVDRIEQYFLKKYYHYLEASDSFAALFAPMPNYPTVYRHSSAYQKIDLVEDPSQSTADLIISAFSDKFEAKPDFPKKEFLFLNGDFQMTSSHEEIYHEYFAHVPIQMHGSIPRKILVLGGGDGILIRELIKYPEVSVRQIDLDPVLINLAKTDPILTAINENSLHDERVTTVIDDGYKVMRDSDQTYDAIYIDFPAPADYNLSKLYSREFFHFVRERLTKNGFLAFDATGIGFLSTPSVMDRQVPVPGNDWPIYYNTLKAAGFDTIVPYVTTLETDNPKAWEILNQVQGNMLIDERVATLLLQTEDTQERETILRLGRQAAIQSALVDHTMSLQQGFIAAAKNPSALRSRRFVELGINLRVLTPARFYLAFEVDFPTTANVEWRYVNSILRPTFPTSPWYQPRLAF